VIKFTVKSLPHQIA